MDREQAVQIRRTIEQARTEMLNRYTVVKSAMRGAFHEVMLGPSMQTPMAKAVLDNRLRDIVKSAIETENRANIYFESQIRQTAGSEDATRATVGLLESFSAQIGSDARVVARLFHTAQLTKSMTGTMNSLRAISDKDLFKYVDRVGKKWDSQRFLETESNRVYYDLANYLSLVQARNEGRATVVMDRPGHSTDGLTLYLDDQEEWTKKLLHPGSQGIVV